MTKAKPISMHDSGASGGDDLVNLLGRSHAAFQALARDRAGVTCEWKRYSKKAPWALKVCEGERTLFYLTPQANRFEVTAVLGQRATDAALAGRVRPELHATIRSAKPYVEGRSVKVVVTSEEDLVSRQTRGIRRADVAAEQSVAPDGKFTSRKRDDKKTMV